MPLDPENVGTAIQVGLWILFFGNPGRHPGHVVIAQSDVAKVHQGQSVVMRIEQLPSALFPVRHRASRLQSGRKKISRPH
jgi:FAD synthase